MTSNADDPVEHDIALPTEGNKTSADAHAAALRVAKVQHLDGNRRPVRIDSLICRFY